jgi:uncharacterized membrane protein
MNSLHAALSPEVTVAGWLLIAPLAAHSLRQAAAGAPLRGAQQHLWLAGAVMIAWLWTLQARFAGGAAFGLLGVAFFALTFGRHWARLGLLAALALHTWLGGGSWANFGINGLMLAALPTLLADVLQRQIERRLPRNLFVFVIGNGLFVTLAVTATVSSLFVTVSSLLSPASASTDQIAYALLLAWGEALASGMLFSSLVIFCPQLVLTYRQDLYLPPRSGR